MENWDRNEWQGKRKSQVEYSTGVAFVCLTLLILLLIFLGIFYLAT